MLSTGAMWACDARWKELELSQLDIPLQSLLGDKSLKTKYSGNLSDLTLLRWVEHDKDFRPAQLEPRFKEMSRNGITSYCIISSNTGLESFQQLQEKYNLGKQDFYRYLQLRHHFDRNIKTSDECDRDLINIVIDAYKGKIYKKVISRIYLCQQSYKKNINILC